MRPTTTTPRTFRVDLAFEYGARITLTIQALSSVDALRDALNECALYGVPQRAHVRRLNLN